MAELMKWQDLPIGGVIIQAGNSAEYVTGGWRTFRPVVDFERCTHCLLCWLMCPDVSMETESGKLTGVDLLHCKGCGICAEVCPPKVIEMVAESAFAAEKEAVR
jgi:2-oxoacid:acceptor oxidoreductase delta subunit (pyruvate/2-ketoisovalerate family)